VTDAALAIAGTHPQPLRSRRPSSGAGTTPPPTTEQKLQPEAGDGAETRRSRPQPRVERAALRLFEESLKRWREGCLGCRVQRSLARAIAPASSPAWATRTPPGPQMADRPAAWA